MTKSHCDKCEIQESKGNPINPIYVTQTLDLCMPCADGFRDHLAIARDEFMEKNLVT